jgi:hypothetical protein
MRLSTQLLIEHLRTLAERGLTLAQTAKETGLSYTSVVKYSIEHDITFKRQMMAPRPGTLARAQDMRQRYEDGETLEQIGQRYNLTRERVRQILTKSFGTTGRDGGQAEQARSKRREFHKKRDARSMKTWGCTYRQYCSLLRRPDRPTYAYWAQVKNAQKRKIAWELSLWQWWKIWEQSGHWAERGRGHGYCMCRLNDVGPYSVDNVYIATGSDNMKDYWARRRAAAPVAEELAQ